MMKNKGNRTGLICFIMHFFLEVFCFATLRSFYPLQVVGIVALIYDAFAFVTQGLIGEAIEKCKKLPFGTIGVLLMALSLPVISSGNENVHLAGFVLLGVGNAIIHELGAVSTVAFSNKKIFPSALFVAGGSFGLITGQALGIAGINRCYLLIPLAIILVCAFLIRDFRCVKEYPTFDRIKTKLSPAEIIIAAFIITTARSYIGYAIPMTWRTENWQGFLLFFTMGIGKAVGGLLTDKFGAKKVGIVTTLLALPFLLAGADNMIISCIGICIFSMTMCVTFEMILTVLPHNPGLAFGITTIGLFLGALPIFFVAPGMLVNCILVAALSLVSACLLYLV